MNTFGWARLSRPERLRIIDQVLQEFEDPVQTTVDEINGYLAERGVPLRFSVAVTLRVTDDAEDPREQD